MLETPSFLPLFDPCLTPLVFFPSFFLSDSNLQLVTASADGTSRVYNTQTGACQAILIGHEGEISKLLQSTGHKDIDSEQR